MAALHDPDFSRLQLGREHPPLEVEGSARVREACLALISQARREVLIMSRQLDRALFDNTQTSRALRDFILQSRRTHLRVLLKDPEPARRHGHRLIELAQRLSSYAEIRVPAPEHHAFNAAFVVADQQGVVHRSLADRYEATVSFADRHLAGECVRQFEEMWETARGDAGLRRLHV
jgi:hypothetical protein